MFIVLDMITDCIKNFNDTNESLELVESKLNVSKLNLKVCTSRNKIYHAQLALKSSFD